MKYRKFFIIMILISLLGSITSLVSPILISIWGETSTDLGYRKVLILVGIMLFVWLVQMLFVYIRERFAVHFNKKNLEDGLELFYQAKYDYLNKTGPSNLLERIIQGVNATYAFMTGDAIQIWSSLFIIIAVLVLTALQSYWITLMLVSIVPVNYFGYKILNNILIKKSAAMQSKLGAGFQEILSVVTQTDYLKQLGNYQKVRNFVEKPAASIYKTMADVNVVAQTASNAISSLNEIVKTVVMLLAVYIYLENQASPYALVLFSILLPLFFSNVSFITNANLGKKDMIAAQKFLEEIRENKEPDGDVEIRDVESIRYAMKETRVGDVLLKSHLEDTFHKGDIVWLRGESGSGKSTLVKYLLKFYQTSDIFVNDIDISKISNRSLRTNIVYCSQQVPIVKGTLRENLFFGNAYDEKKENDMLLTNIGQQLLETKELSSVIDENGANLSGGEKQKIVALRTAFQDASVFVLDEITSNVDPECAKEIYELFLENSKNRITFFISHDDLPQAYANKLIQVV
ncbi:MAG: ABC transporter ATP-binding protein [Clostridiaceae bacterium]|nr:ABC transporter ATP-binding protein [Clostridiaceae bacterium]